MIDEQVLSFIVRFKALNEFQSVGISRDHFVDEYRSIFSYLVKQWREYEAIPSRSVVESRFPEATFPTVRRTDLPMLIHDIKQRKKVMDVLHALNEAASSVDTPDDIDGIVQELVGKLNNIAYTGRGQSHLVDIFAREARERLLGEIDKRGLGEIRGIPTGLPRFDRMAGGMQRQKMITVMARTGQGKSWMCNLFLATAILNGQTFMLYPLEMNLTEVAFRLYTLFSSQMLGADRVIKNYDLTTGAVSRRKVVRFLNTLEDRFAGKLFVADVGSLAEPYTNERIEAEVQANSEASGFWVDYIQLLKALTREEGAAQVKQLSNGVKNTAMRQNVVGGVSAQINREAVKGDIFLPRVEHIYGGDAIGQDSDQVISLARRGRYLYYGLVKNRGGIEFGATKVMFDVNNGVLREMPRQQDENGESDE